MKKVDKTGKIFGKWTVIRKAPNNKRQQTMWLCRCFCGTEKIVIGGTLGKWSKSCGRCEADKTGKRFGRWMVIKRVSNNKHQQGMWLCKCICGTEKIIVGRSLGRSSTSCGCYHKEVVGVRGEKHWNWKGGRYIAQYGYIKLRDPIYSGDGGRKQIFEHTVVMARHLGRPLMKGETIHHKNGIRHDNRIENLELWNRSHPPGQRVEDLVVWAQELLSRYKPERLAQTWESSIVD